MIGIFREVAEFISLVVEAIAVIIIALGALETVCRIIQPWLIRQVSQGIRRDAWQNFARWLLLGLEFTLAADIIRTAISPTWDDIGQLAAIAFIRTFLNYFLERDLKEECAEAKRS